MKKIIFLLVGVMLISGCSYKNIGFGNSKKTSVCPVVNCGRTESLYKSDRVTDGNGKMKFVEECCTFIAYTGEVVVEGEFLYAFKTDSRLEYEQTPNLYFYPNSSAKYPLDWKPSFIHEGGPIESVAPIRSTFKIDNIDEAVQKFGLSDGVKKLGSKGGSITGNAIIKISGFNLNTSESFGSDSTKLVEVIEKSNVVVKNLETTPSKIINWCDDEKTVGANELWISSEDFNGLNHAPSVRHVCRGDKELFYLQMDWNGETLKPGATQTGKLIAVDSTNVFPITSVNKDPEVKLVEDKNSQSQNTITILVDGKNIIFDLATKKFSEVKLTLSAIEKEAEVVNYGPLKFVEKIPGRLLYSGEVVINGVYGYTSGSSMEASDGLSFTPDEESAKLLPQFDVVSNGFNVSNRDQMIKMLGLTDVAKGKICIKGKATIKISGYSLNIMEFQAYNYSKVVEVLSKENYTKCELN